MKIKDTEAIGSDALIALHCLNTCFSEIGEKDELGYSSAAYKRYTQSDDFLSNLLWGAVSYGNTIRDYPFNYLSLQNPPIRSIIDILLTNDIKDITCRIRADKKKIGIYDSSPYLKDLLTTTPDDFFHTEETISLWKKIRQELETDSYPSVTSTLDRAIQIIQSLLNLRTEEYLNAVRGLNSLMPDESHLVREITNDLNELKSYRPFSLDLLEAWRQIYPVTKKIEDDYLQDFMQDAIVWVDNPMRWDKKMAHLRPVLKQMFNEHGPFWISLGRLQSIEQKDFNPTSIQLPETLFALQKRGELIVTQCRRNEFSDIDFRVHLLSQASTPSTLPIQSSSTWLFPEDENRKAIDTDFLLLIHLLARSFVGIEQKMKQDHMLTFFEGTSLADEEIASLYRDILADLLWETISCGYIEGEPYRHDTADDVLIFRLIYWLVGHEKEFANLKFQVSLSDREKELYPKTSIPAALSEEMVSDTLIERQLWDSLIEGDSYTLNLGGDNTYRFLHLLLLARAETIEKFQSRSEFGEFMQEAEDVRLTCRPIRIDLLSEPTNLREFCKQRVEKYLRNFINDNIDWGTNQPKWERQVEYFMPIFKALDHEHGAFWISTAELQQSHHWLPESGYRLVETLLALSLEEQLDILLVRRKGFGIEFKVQLKTPAAIIPGDTVPKEFSVDMDKAAMPQVLAVSNEPEVEEDENDKSVIKEVNGVFVNLSDQEVTYEGETVGYKVAGLPWKIFQLCALDKPDRKGIIRIETLGVGENELNVTLSRINRKWKKKAGARLLYVKDKYIHLAPKPWEEGDDK